jgi:signal transduction histidine kinase
VVIYDSLGGAGEGTGWAHPDIMQALDGYHSHSTDEVDGGISIHTAVPVTAAEGDNMMVIGAVMLSHTMTDAHSLVSGINNQIMWLIAAIGAGVAVLVLLIAAWLLNPLNNVLSAVKNISEGHLNQRISLRGKDEISALGTAVNNMTQKLERTETARQEFVSNVSHELRTPLSSIKVLSESLLHRENVEKEVYKEFLSDITSEVDRMADIIDELLTLVRLDEVELPLNISYFCLNGLLEEVIKRLRPLALVDGINIELAPAPAHQIFIEGDEMKLNLAISNLIENAVKYSFEGGLVKVLLDVDAKSAFVTVSDRGAGISEEDQEKVFSRFFRADKGRNRQTGGTGLGLAITHKTILLHKGSIKLSSKIGEGSIFTLRIPLQYKS